MEFRDLKAQYRNLKDQIDQAMAEVLHSAHFISGPQVGMLEKQLADYVGAKHCITCANGTDAISIALLAHGIGEGDAVFVPDFTFFLSGECPAALGATPIFVDVKKDTYNMDSESLEQAIQKVISENKYKPKAVVAVDLFGLPADYDTICSICAEHGLLLLEDAAQGFGGSMRGRKACSFGDIAITSFFPAKPLGCYGDGGAIFTDDDEVASLCRSIAVHGKDMEHPDDPGAKYNNIRLGMNSRLDTLQAAILLPKFQAFREYELENINKIASVYTELLSGIDGLAVPVVEDGFYSSWAQYTVQLPADADREGVRRKMARQGIPTMVYYPKPMHRQRAFVGKDSARAECPVTEELCDCVLCLPIHPYLTMDACEKVADTLRRVLL